MYIKIIELNQIKCMYIKIVELNQIKCTYIKNYLFNFLMKIKLMLQYFIDLFN